MRKSIPLFLIFCITVVMLSACGSGSPAATQPTKADIPASTQNAPIEVSTPTVEPVEMSPAVIELADSGSLGKYDVQINDFTLCQDYSGSPAIVIGYTFTNNDEENRSAIVALNATAFQNGVQLDSAAIMDNSVYDSSNSMKELQPGASLDIQCAYILSSDVAPVEFEIAETFSLSNERLGKTFALTADGVTELSVAPGADSAEKVGDFAVSILSHSVVKDYEGKPAVLINLGFTNNSSKTTSFLSEIDCKAFQDGIQLESAIISDASIDVGASQLRSIRPGAGHEVTVAYKITSDSSPIDIEIKGLFDFSGDMVKSQIDLSK